MIAMELKDSNSKKKIGIFELENGPEKNAIRNYQKKKN